MNGYQSESEDNSPKPHRVCCLIEDKERCKRLAGNACYSKRIQKTVAQKKLKLAAAESVSTLLSTLIFIKRREMKQFYYNDSTESGFVFRQGIFISVTTIKT